MPLPHNVIALISGGKDSFLALLHCLSQNHQIIALANLYPPPSSPIPLPPGHTATPDPHNSYMYQTVGHTLIPLYASALDIPLYRAQISSAGAKSHAREYHPPPPTMREDEDETESLIPLLRQIQRAHPSSTALCSGAILSTYQRTRIESVALRLGLTPLTPLWQYPSLPTPFPRPAGLLEDASAVGLKANIIKVASGGLHEGFLWDNLSDANVRAKVERAVDKFGGSVLGEGGEYETLVLDGPAGVWKGKMMVRDYERFVGRGQGGEAWLAFPKGGGEVVPKERNEDRGWREKLVVPGLWDEGWEELVARIADEEEGILPTATGSTNNTNNDTGTSWIATKVTTTTPSTLGIFNLTAPSPTSTASEQMQSIISTHLIPLLATHILPASSIVFTTLLLRSMADFVSLNETYGALFHEPIPPARVTVACGDALPQGVKIMASFLMDRGKKEGREGLHVQSRSYWAPANIGPYSQAIAVPLLLNSGEEDQVRPEVVYVAGQIPLVPASMELIKDNSADANADHGRLEKYGTQTCLALQHLWRIGKSMRVSCWLGGVAFIAPPSSSSAERKARLVWNAWKLVHQPDFNSQRSGEEDDVPQFDVWDRKFNGGGGFGGMNEREKEKDTLLPDWERVKSEETVPGFFAVHVDQLPRGSEVEWQALGARKCDVRIEPHNQSVYDQTSCSIPGRSVSYLSILPGASVREALSTIQHTQEITIYTSLSQFDAGVEAVDGAQIVPCKNVWGREGRMLAAGVVVVAHGV